MLENVFYLFLTTFTPSSPFIWEVVMVTHGHHQHQIVYIMYSVTRSADNVLLL